MLVTLSLYNSSVFSANSASSCCLKDFSELRSLSLKRTIKGKLLKTSSHKLWVYIYSKGFFAGLIFVRAYFQRGLLLEGNYMFQNGLDLIIKTA